MNNAPCLKAACRECPFKRTLVEALTRAGIRPVKIEDDEG